MEVYFITSYIYLAWGFLNFLLSIPCCLFLSLIILQDLLFLYSNNTLYIHHIIFIFFPGYTIVFRNAYVSENDWSRSPNIFLFLYSENISNPFCVVGNKKYIIIKHFNMLYSKTREHNFPFWLKPCICWLTSPLFMLSLFQPPRGTILYFFTLWV